MSNTNKQAPSFTPGPWWLSLHDADQHYDIGQGDRAMFRTVLPPLGNGPWITNYKSDHVSSNARLIAAATDLYAALERAERAPWRYYSWIDEARAALAKAKGGQS